MSPLDAGGEESDKDTWMTDSARSCLDRLREMDVALEAMERELPEDVRAIGAAARQRVAACMRRVAESGADEDDVPQALREIARMMDALTARLLFVPWDHPKPRLES